MNSQASGTTRLFTERTERPEPAIQRYAIRRQVNASLWAHAALVGMDKRLYEFLFVAVVVLSEPATQCNE